MNIDNPLVSIVIPAYNVEKYISQCIGSCVKQSMNQIEIIVVDDGSTDSTGEIIEKWSQKDSRIKIIHQENGGVSAARNKGINNSSGEYITFVDGDDFLAMDYIAYMLHLIRKDDSDFAVSLNCYTKKGGKQVKQEKYKVIKPEDAVALLLSPKIIVGCWNKIYKKSFISREGLRFSTDLFYGEGLDFITTVAQKSNHVAIGNRKSYYYRRNNQTSATTKFKIESVYNGETSIDRIEAKMLFHTQLIQDMLLLHRSMYYIGAIAKLEEYGMVKKYHKDYKRWLSFIREHIYQIWSCRDVSIYRKLLLTGGCISPRIMTNLNILRKKKISSHSVS